MLAPKKRVLSPTPSNKVTSLESVPLIVKGQGIVSLLHPEKTTLSFTIQTKTHSSITAIRLTVEADQVRLELHGNEGWKEAASNHDPGVGLDPDPKCRYWYSLDYHNHCIRYGKGEMRLFATLFTCHLPEAGSNDPYVWIADTTHVVLNPAHKGDEVEVWRDPVTTEPPLIVLSRDEIAMDNIALNNATVIENLTPTCQILYANVSGPNFQLNTPDFPDFVDAIEESIRNPKGWCYQELRRKAGEFDPDHPDLDETYLRITMGVNQGDSPGIPYVMEIWPPGHFSPIHNHAGANAIIRVLSGNIQVKLFPMLSHYHETPFAEKVFSKDDVTWITPTLNQTHQLKNPFTDGPTCITIQCYMYGENNTIHYGYFDYIQGDSIQQFDPNSDMGFLEFKATMRKEWEQFQSEN